MSGPNDPRWCMRCEAGHLPGRHYAKPLELIVYPHVVDGGMDCIEDSEGTFRIDRELDAFAEGKRFTEAELAAEVFRQAAWIGANGRAHKTDAGRNIVFEAAFTFGPMTRDEHEFLVINQFATLPHYDEQDQA